MNRCIYRDRYFELVAPASPLNCREDGGHLVLVKEEKVTDRSEMTWQETIAFMRISMAAGKAMYEVLGVERMNYEDLGNWGLDEPGGAKMHLHLFGRARVQIHQIRGQHMSLYPQNHPIYQGHLKPLAEEDCRSLETRIREILSGEKYVKLAELAAL
jgi:diadenosine tetraphosphate (Ap4A) HIT family hydrolase